jgi:hypothetical protein
MRLKFVGSAHHVKKDSTSFWHLTLKSVVRNLKQRVYFSVHLKNTGDCVQSRDESIGVPFDPLFWLDNTFKHTFVGTTPLLKGWKLGLFCTVHFGRFSCSWIWILIGIERIRIQESQIYEDPYGSRSTTLRKRICFFL